LAACGFAADWAGLHFMVGAFLAGAVMDAHWFDQEKMDLMRHHAGVHAGLLPEHRLRTNWGMGGSAVSSPQRCCW
jgi:hypothetical protein